MFKRLFKDSFLLGIFLGLIPLALAWITYTFYDNLMDGFSLLKIKLYPPRLQLIILGITILIFRFMMVKWNMIETGKGLFLIVFIGVIIYFFKHRYKMF